MAAHPFRMLSTGAPIGDVLRTFDGFTVSYDTRLRNPRWVLERLTSDSSNGDGNRQNVQFKEDGAIEPRFRAKLSDYQRTGYDRGHMVISIISSPYLLMACTSPARHISSKSLPMPLDLPY